MYWNWCYRSTHYGNLKQSPVINNSVKQLLLPLSITYLTSNICSLHETHKISNTWGSQDSYLRDSYFARCNTLKYSTNWPTSQGNILLTCWRYQNLKDRGSRLLWNISKCLPDYTVSHSQRQYLHRVTLLCLAVYDIHDLMLGTQ